MLLIPLGLMLGAAAIGLAYPFIMGLPGSEQNVIPRFANKWSLGTGAENQPAMQYVVKYQEMEFTADMRFLEQSSDEQKVRVIIDDKKTGEQIDRTLVLGKAYVFVNTPAEMRQYINALDATVLSTRNIVVEPQYLVVGAEWGTTFIGKLTPKLHVTHYEDTEFEFGTLKTFLVSYRIGDIENTFWISDGLPLPVRAEYYTIDGDFDYSYDLIRLE